MKVIAKKIMNKIQIKEVAGSIVATMGSKECTTPRNQRLSFFQEIDSLLSDELDAIYQKVFGKELYWNNNITVEIEHGGNIHHWAWTLAHYCFAKGRLTEEEFVGLIKKS